MIIIDKLCYRSKLRYVSAAEKLLYAVSSLMICVLTRSYAAALIVFIAMEFCTVRKGERYFLLSFVVLVRYRADVRSYVTLIFVTFVR